MVNKTIEVSRSTYLKLKDSSTTFDDFLKTDMEGMGKEEIKEKRDDLLWDISFSARNLVLTANGIEYVKDRMEISGRYYDRLKEKAGALDNYINSKDEAERWDAVNSDQVYDFLWPLSFSTSQILRSTRNMYLSYIRKEMKEDLDCQRITDQEYRCLFRNLDAIKDQMDHVNQDQYRKAADDILKSSGLQITDSIGSDPADNFQIPSINGSTLMQ